MKSNWSRLLQECSYFSVMSQSIRTMFLGFSLCTTLGGNTRCSRDCECERGECIDLDSSFGSMCVCVCVCTQWLYVSVLLPYSDAKGWFEYVMVACSSVSRCHIIAHNVISSSNCFEETFSFYVTCYLYSGQCIKQHYFHDVGQVDSTKFWGNFPIFAWLFDKAQYFLITSGPL